VRKLIGLAVFVLIAGCSDIRENSPPPVQLPVAQSPAVQSSAATRPWVDTSLAPETRASLLVQQMTLDEKILEIHMIDQKAHPREVSGIDRLGIPTMRITNGPAGAGPGDARPTQPATALPAAIALAASWDPDLATKFGQVLGTEVAARGEHVVEGPGVNITRVPRNGRNFEYFGEDPYLSARMGVAEIEGIQQQRVIAEVKHFACNNQETNRKTINEIVDERTLREIYLPAFEAAVKEGHVAAVMAAYPSVNNQFCSENVHLLKDVLRGEWGFAGFVQSDYTGTHGADGGAKAGLDLSMKADHYGPEMKTAIAGGQISESTIDTMLIRRFAQMYRFGMMDGPRTPQPLAEKEDGAAARAIAAQCTVLLKNEGDMLPLNVAKLHTIAVIGPYAGAAHTGGGGSSMVKAVYTVSPVDGIKHRVGAAVNVVYNDGADPAMAAAAAKDADVVLLMVGNKDSEGKDRPDLQLPKNQSALVSAVAAANPRTIVVLKTGGVVLMPWIDHVPAILEAWYPGEEDGNVVADLVFGDVNPSGKLPMTFPRSETQTPVSSPSQYPGVNATAIYSEKLDVGYRWYDAQNQSPLFPFGFGLSYTTFAMNNLAVSRATSGQCSASLDVTNTGPREGAEVVQIYVAAPPSAGEPPKQLKGFKKVTLKPGETCRVEIALDTRAFSIWDTKVNQWRVFPGEYQILAGDSSRDLPLRGTITIR
jgi:beta-glucosidase